MSEKPFYELMAFWRNQILVVKDSTTEPSLAIVAIPFDEFVRIIDKIGELDHNVREADTIWRKAVNVALCRSDSYGAVDASRAIRRVRQKNKKYRQGIEAALGLIKEIKDDIENITGD